MKIILLIISTFLNMSFMQMNHPLTMGLILLLQTILVSMITGMFSQMFWFSYILFLIFLGGMLILFIYVTSLASNEMFYFSMKMIMKMMFIFLILIIFIIILNPQLNNENSMFLYINNYTNNYLIKLYNQPISFLITLLASYLFLTLIAVVKITSIFKGPLRQMN